MDIEKALELLDSDIRHEYKSKLSAIIKGFELISKYDPKSCFVSVQDQIRVGNFETTVELMTEDEVLTMAKNGWFHSEDGWSIFV